MTANNFDGLKELTRMVEGLMDANAHAHDILSRSQEMGEIEAEVRRINEIQAQARDKRRQYMFVLAQVDRLLEGAEEKEDLLQLRLLDLCHRNEEDAEGAAGHITDSTCIWEGWFRKHYHGIKDMLLSERVSA